MAGNTQATVQSNQTFGTTPVPIAVGVLNPANSPQTVWDCGVGMYFASMTTTITGSPASFTILLEGTYDGSNWFTVATTTNVAGETVYGSSSLPFTNLRARCTAVSGGSSPTVNVFATASEQPPGGIAAGASVATVGVGDKIAIGSLAATTAQSAATTGVGTTVDFGSAVGTVEWQIVPTGTVTAGQISMQVSLDGQTWFTPPTAAFSNLSGATLANPYVLVTGTNALFDLGAGNVAVRYARANITTGVTGGATVTVLISGY